MKPLSIYIHIPFCQSKCFYCDFLSAKATSDQEMTDYVAALIYEIEMEAPKYRDYEVQTVFFGGGTPSILPGDMIMAILCKLQKAFTFSPTKQPEITIEINPGTITGVILSKYKAAGINRLSFGLQSANAKELKRLGRIHNYGEFLSTYKKARELGFQNINIDLIQAIPGQTFRSWKKTLKKAARLKPEHISAYSIIIEPGTIFGDKYADGQPEAYEIADEKTDRQIYHYTKKYLEKKNNIRYEISNYARPGYECRHNLTYWRRNDFLGFGLGASSLIGNKRWKNISELKSYIMIYLGGKQPEKEELQVLSLKDQIEEYMFLGLRVTEGVNICHFEKTFKQDIYDFYGPLLQKLKEQKLISISDNNITLTSYGIDISNYVLAQFLLK
ncbi:MAG: radical SAM family heme chaperone HemW [Lachnospiraceae bacterium]|nr:radical SAM family heme chaperone HemW [Lachnospiraceae bacterium]